MDKKVKIYLGILAAAIAVIVYMEMVKPTPVNWFPSFAAKHKIPYGTYILKNEMNTLFKDIKEVNNPPYIYLNDTTVTGTYFFLNGNVSFDKAELKKLLAFVNRGNDVFIASSNIDIDTLDLETDDIVTLGIQEKISIGTLNSNLHTDLYPFDKGAPKTFFSDVNSTKTAALGKIFVFDEDGNQEDDGINFIKYTHGKGTIYFHTFPLAFTNYNMLTDKNYEYVANVLSYIDEGKPLLWDAYYKNGKAGIRSQMHYVLSSKNLKYAYYTALIAILFFIIFKGKRDQRFIKVITPLKNQTLAFTKTIASMYYEKSDHKNIADQKINYFLEYIRDTFKIPTDTINETFYTYLSQRSSNSVDSVVNLFKKIKIIQSQYRISKEQLIELNTLIETFKKIKH